MAKKTTRKPTDSLPMGDGTEADQAPPVEADAAPADPPPEPDGDPADNGKPARDRQSAAPYCEQCGERMKANNSTPEVTRYYCPGCGHSKKQHRPQAAPVCPYCKSVCTVTHKGPRTYVSCEECHGYHVSTPRVTRYADQADDFAAR